MLFDVQKGRWKNVEEAAEVMKDYMLENLLSTHPDNNEIRKSKVHREAIWKEAVEKGFLRLPKQADIIADGRRDLRYALQVTSSLFLGLVRCL